MRAQVKSISGKGMKCQCGQQSATLYVIRVAGRQLTLCPWCKSDLCEALKKEEKLWEGY